MILYIIAAAVLGLNTFVLYMMYSYFGFPNMLYQPYSLASIAFSVLAVAVVLMGENSSQPDENDLTDIEQLLEQSNMPSMSVSENTQPSGSNYYATASPSIEKPHIIEQSKQSPNPLVDALAYAIRNAKFEVEGGLRLELNKSKVKISDNISAELYGNLVFESKNKNKDEKPMVSNKAIPQEQVENALTDKVPKTPLDVFIKRKITELEGEE